MFPVFSLALDEDVHCSHVHVPCTLPGADEGTISHTQNIPHLGPHLHLSRLTTWTL